MPTTALERLESFGPAPGRCVAGIGSDTVQDVGDADIQEAGSDLGNDGAVPDSRSAPGFRARVRPSFDPWPALLAYGLGTRPSLGHPGAKYETGVEDIEQIEIIAAELAAEVFDADHVEIRVPSGAMANLYAFMAGTRPGDTITAPPASIAGHVTHHGAGVAGLYGLASVIFDAAHLSGLIAGGAWPNPLADGADVMIMSTYKSLGGRPACSPPTTRPWPSGSTPSPFPA